MIEFTHVSKDFGSGEKMVRAVRDVSLTIQDGEIFGIIGFSGAGKSTLVRCINLLERPTNGTVVVDGKEMTALSPKELRLARRKIGMIFQHFNLMPSRTVFGNVAYPLQGQGLSKQAIQNKVLKLLKLVDIADVDEGCVSSAWNAILPLLALVGGTLYFDNDLLHGTIIALIVQFLLYVPQKRMTVGDYFRHILDGAKGMTTIAIVVLFGLVLSNANRQLGMFDILITGVGGAVPSWLIAPMAFLLVALTVFAVGSCWAVMTIAFPVFIPMGLAAGVAPSLMIAAVMSGVTLGYSVCFYADAIFMTTAGTGVSNITIVRSTLPYAAVVTVLSAAALLVAGL